MKPKVSVVIPTIEEETLFDIIAELRKKLRGRVEIIVVDKSGDAYYNRVVATGVTVLRQKDNGVERALMMGLKHAHGEILASTDADGTHGIEGIFKGIGLVEQGKADLVLGNRFGKLQKGSMSLHLRFGNAFLSKVYSIMYRSRLSDVLTGLFVMRRGAFEKIRENAPYRAGIAFFAIELANRGYKIVDVPINYYPRKYGGSKLTKSKIFYGVNVASHIIRKARDYNPLLIFGGFGVVLIVLGGLLGIYVLYNYFATGTFLFIGRTLIAFMLVIVGILAIIGGFILDLLLEIERKLNK
ncbi:MAG: glycosyltransferase [Candidatus Micrarchaeota archaeon]|nr:glycosyltransferase [Candidatus Micrarchaeota archaeon]MDE1847402.1 glycosyltransferase [Candidatus Micrarchaeota archaeon]MDE1864017.1 glycosyltransferase [Candidatus Micrarchaeota archaeon]